MQYQFFTIPVGESINSTIIEELNTFLRSHRILQVAKNFLPDASSPCWCFCVEYIENDGGVARPFGKAKVDYRNILDEKAFELFRKLRECRKQIAEETAVPPFAVFIDEQLAEMTKLPEITVSSLRSINGIGDKKIEKYAMRFLELLNKAQNEEKR